jgi:hypothetical protein
MKIASISLALGLYAALPASACLQGSFTFQFEGDCNRETLVEAYEDQVYSATGAIPRSCAKSAEEDFDEKLSAADTSVGELCSQVYDAAEKVPFHSASKRGKDMLFEQMFFNGRTNWQEEVQTIYETDDESATSVLKQDAENIRAFHEGTAQGRRVAWPGELTNFQSSKTDDAGDPTCTTNAAMCCWPKDRQANDGNGNCAKGDEGYDVNCVSKDPADNTNLCYVDMERGNESTVFDSEGFLGYGGDNNNGEGAIHCHGLAWSNDVNDHTARYRGNNIFFVSMYDHMYQRGYVENIPGAPMCGCVEQMPTVTRSDCTQVDLTESIRITFNSRLNTFTGKLTDVHVDFNACRGINNRNNDLWAYMARLYYQGDIDPGQFGEAGRIITNTDYCDEAQRYELNQRGYTPGFDHDVDQWTLVAGREAMALHNGYGMEAFNQAMAAGASSEDGHFGIIRRICQDCAPSHQSIYYRRLTSIPSENNLISNLLYSSRKDPGNIWNVDFTLHSTYDDAVAGDNPWKCPNNSFNYQDTFVGECSADGTRVRRQESRFDIYQHRKNVAFYVNKPESEGLQVETDGLYEIRGQDSARGTVLRDSDDGTIVINGVGRSIHKVDDVVYYAQTKTGDLTVVVHAGNMQQASHWQNPSVAPWAKAGIMIRSSLDSDSVHYSLLLTGNNGVAPQARECTGCNMRWWGGNTQVNKGAKEAWLKLEKRVTTLITYVGEQDVAGGPIIWSQTHSIEYPQLGDEFYVGLAVSSGYTFPLEVTFSNYEVEQFFFPSAAPSISAAPTVFVASRDIGNVGIAGSASESSTGRWTVTSSGNYLWGRSDRFHFVNFQVSGPNVEVRFRVDSFDYVNPWQKGGVMIRDTMDADSAHFSVFVTGNQRLASQWRAGTGSSTSHVGGGTNDKPVWIKGVKDGNSFSSYFSYDGSLYHLLHGPVTINFTSDDMEVGIAVNSNVYNRLVTLTGSDLVIEQPASSGRKLRGSN